jgi:hypothetical protein
MADPRAIRLVETVLQCYPARWRRRHGDEAAELAALLIKDGTPAGSIAWSYLAGAVREWLTPRPGQRPAARSLRAGRLGRTAGLRGAGQGGHEPGARTRALSGWLA